MRVMSSHPDPQGRGHIRRVGLMSVLALFVAWALIAFAVVQIGDLVEAPTGVVPAVAIGLLTAATALWWVLVGRKAGPVSEAVTHEGSAHLIRWARDNGWSVREGAAAAATPYPDGLVAYQGQPQVCSTVLAGSHPAGPVEVQFWVVTRRGRIGSPLRQQTTQYVTILSSAQSLPWAFLSGSATRARLARVPDRIVRLRRKDPSGTVFIADKGVWERVRDRHAAVVPWLKGAPSVVVTGGRSVFVLDDYQPPTPEELQQRIALGAQIRDLLSGSG